jgi:hypothetical protein
MGRGWWWQEHEAPWRHCYELPAMSWFFQVCHELPLVFLYSNFHSLSFITYSHYFFAHCKVIRILDGIMSPLNTYVFRFFWTKELE